MKNILSQHNIKIMGKTYTSVYFPTPLTSLKATNGHSPWLWSVRNIYIGCHLCYMQFFYLVVLWMVATCCYIDDVFLNLLKFSLFAWPFLNCSALKSLSYILPLTVTVQCVSNPNATKCTESHLSDLVSTWMKMRLELLAFDCITFDELLANVIIHGMKICRSDADLCNQRWRIVHFIPKYTKESFSRHRH